MRTVGEVVGAGLLAHVPTIMLPAEQRRELNEGTEISLVPGLNRLREEIFETLDYDTVLVLDSHWHTTVEFVVAAHETRAGLFTSDELPRGMCRVPYDWQGDPELAHAIAAQADKHGTWITPIDDPYLPVHYATVNLWHYLGRGLDRRWMSISNTAYTGDTEDFLRAGRAIGAAIAATDRRVVLIASGALSHTFWPLRELRAHEASDPAHIRTEPGQGGRRGPDRMAAGRRARQGDRHDGCVPGGTARSQVRALPDDDRRARRPHGDGAGQAVQRLRELDRHRPDAPVVRPAARRLDSTGRRGRPRAPLGGRHAGVPADPARWRAPCRCAATATT